MIAIDPAELEQITRRKRPRAQRRVLDAANIPYVWVDGRPIVCRSALQQSMKPEPRLRLSGGPQMPARQPLCVLGN